MTQNTYRIVPKPGSSYDVEVTEAGGVPRSLGCFNFESEAWGWIVERQRVTELTERRDARLLLNRGP
jgi:hypothetical protein